MRRQNRKNGIFCLSDSHTIRPITKRGAQTKRPKGQTSQDNKSQGTKRPKGQNVSRDKHPKGQNLPRTKRPTDKTSRGTKRTDTVPVETANPHKTTWLSHCPISQESQHSNSVVYPNTLFWIQIQDFGPIWIRIRIQDYAFNF